MKTKSKKLSDSRVELTVTLDAKDLKPAREKALEKLAKEIKVEGFRKGKVPKEVAEKFIPENDINTFVAVLKKVCANISDFGKKTEEIEL